MTKIKLDQMITRKEKQKAEDLRKQQENNASAREYLAATDWYVIRYTETGQAVPKEVSAKRARCRQKVTSVSTL